MPTPLAQITRCIAVVLLVASAAVAGTVRTRDGKTYEGAVQLAEGAKLQVTLRDGASVTIDLADVEMARFADGRGPATTQSATRPAAWLGVDVGRVSAAGAATINAARILVEDHAGGLPDDKSPDSFHFVYQRLAGDAQVVARVLYMGDAKDAQAGVMFRQSLAADAPYVMASRTNDRRLSVLRARGTGGPPVIPATAPAERGTGGPPVIPPAGVVARADRGVAGAVWLKLVRSGNSFSAFESYDGTKWQLLGETIVAMPADREIYVGLAAASVSGGNSLFDQVTLTAGGGAAAAGLPRGVVSVNGSFVVGQVQSIKDGALTLRRGELDLKLPLDQVSRIILRSLSPADMAKLGTGQPGVLLAAGDFLDGEVKDLGPDRLRVDSVVFGPKVFDLWREVSAVALRPPAGARAGWEVRLSDGSILRVGAIKVEAGRLMLEAWEGKELRVGVGEVVDLQRRAGEKR